MALVLLGLSAAPAATGAIGGSAAVARGEPREPAPGAQAPIAPAAPSAPESVDATSLAAVIRAADAAGGELGPRLAVRLSRWRELVPADEFHWELDAARRLIFASAVDDAAIRARIRAEAASVVDAALPLLFGEPPADPVLVVVVSDPRLARTLIAPGAHVGGRYVHADRVLAVREIGISLRHELIHALHFGHMERLGMRQPHAFWIQEGLAALFETYVPGAPGTEPATLTVGPSDRDPIVQRLAAAGGLDALTEFDALDGRGFMRSARRNYAVARGAMRWLADRGVLADWYRRLGDGAEPGDALTAMAAALDVAPSELDAAFTTWAKAASAPETGRRTGGPWLGVDRFTEADGVGLQVVRVARRGPARTADLRPGDVILELDGAVTPTEVELERLLSGRLPGQTVRLTLRRRGDPADLELVLGRWDPSPGRRRGSSR